MPATLLPCSRSPRVPTWQKTSAGGSGFLQATKTTSPVANLSAQAVLYMILHPIVRRALSHLGYGHF